MKGFLEQLREGLKRCGVGRERILVAVSGGADSVALLSGLIEVASSDSLELFVAHLNHRLRGHESDMDATFVEDLAARHMLPCEIGNAASDELVAGTTGLEETARNIRYRFLERVAAKLECKTIALAHTADDQAETVLHHLFRGTGITGLRGIPATRTTQSGARLVRPILAIRRRDIEEYLRDRGQSFRTDATNTDLSMTRNQMRHVVLPMLREQINPQVDSAICRLADQAREIEDFIRTIAFQLLEQSLKETQPETCRLDVNPLANQPRPVIRELFREIWRRQNWPMQAMGFEQWDRLADTVGTRETITLPNRIEARFHSEQLLVLRQL